MTDAHGPKAGSGEPDPTVRLVGRDEAAAAIRSGQAIGRRPAGQAGPPPNVVTEQPVRRFPLSPSARPQSEVGREVVDLRGDSPDAGGPASAGGDLPHWTQPGTGEVPAVLASDEPPIERGPRWQSGDDWQSQPEAPSMSDLGEASGLGERGSSPEVSEEVDMRSVDDLMGEGGDDADRSGTDPQTEDSSVRATPSEGRRFRAEPEPFGEAKYGEGTPPVYDAPAGSHHHGADTSVLTSASMKKRVATGAIFAATALAAFAGGPVWVLALTTAVLLLAAIEFFDALRRVGYRPATLLGLVAVAGTILGAYARGDAAITLMVALTLVFTFLWYLVGVSKAAPASNVAATLLGYVWIGVLGAFAALLLRMPDERGLAFVIGAVLVTVAYDTGAYLGGSMIGRHPLAPSISPSKTWEGLIVGTIAAVAVGVLAVQAISPWGVVSGLLLGVVVSVVAPVGDLVESMVKRDLGLKDMGRILPGHGGILDRFDALLFVLPATYYLVRLLDLA